MKRKELVKNLKEASKTEEEVVKIYVAHFKAFIQRFNVDKADLNKLISLANVLEKDSSHHKSECEELIQYIERKKKDDF